MRWPSSSPPRLMTYKTPLAPRTKSTGSQNPRPDMPYIPMQYLWSKTRPAAVVVSIAPSFPSTQVQGRLAPPHWQLPCAALRGAALDEVKLLEVPAHNRAGVQPQPLLHHGGVETPEVVVGSQVALLQVGGLERRILAIHPALDPIADDERCPTGAVIGARAVVVHTATKLGKQHHNQIVAGVVLPQVVEKVLEGRGDIDPQLIMHRDLVEVGIEAAMCRVEQLRPQVGQVDLGDIAQIFRDRGVGILHRRSVLLGGGLEDIDPLQHVLPGVA